MLAIEPERIDRLAKVMNHFEWTDPKDTLARQIGDVGLALDDPRIRLFSDLWQRIQNLPRHLGQHSGGMVICQGRLDEVVPLERAAMPGRVVVQWDKDDCADMGIVKVDLLGLGMMAVLQDALEVVNNKGVGVGGWGLGEVPSPDQAPPPSPQPLAPSPLDLAHLPPDDPVVYRMLQDADTIGVFQVESRAQMATLPRLRPTRFYDIVVEVAIIRPGPIVGQMVHPYLKRRAGLEPVTYPHPALEPILQRTLGVPLFQEQLLRIAMVAAGFSGGEAEELRRAFGFKRSAQRMKQIEGKLRAGMAKQGITGTAAEQIIQSIAAFALYGFPESHAASFALLVYASAYLKAHFPAAFYTAMLNNQPMGFYHPATLVKDAQRRGVRFASIDVQRSSWSCVVEADGAIHLGLRYVTGLREEVGRAIEGLQPSAPGPQVPGSSSQFPVRFTSIEDLIARTGLRRDELATLAEIGALNSFGYDRRSALWQIGRAVRPSGELFEQKSTVDSRRSTAGRQSVEEIFESRIQNPESPLPSMTPTERLVADYAGTGLTVGPHPMAFRRDELALRGVLRAIDLPRTRNGRRVRVAGAVITRQRPGTAKGFVFLTLEDETGIANVIIQPDLYATQRTIIIEEPFLLVEGVLQIQDGVTSVKADRLQGLRGGWPEVESRNFC